ncbi:MAG: double zinc ribbon domain-containing protein [Candidatus Helarchaeota archaeon]
MKLQTIKRNGRSYFHVYLPKNIVEHILNWEKGDKLIFNVIKDGLILRKCNIPDFKNDNWDTLLECNVCNKRTVFIKGVIKKNQLILISRCSKCKNRKKIFLDLDEKDYWLNYIEDMIERCDVCNEKSLKKVRVRYGWDWKAINYVTIVYFCKNCNIERTKIIPYEILSDIRNILPRKVELPKIHCIFCGFVIKNYDETTCPNCNNIIVCKKCGNYILEKNKYCIHCGEIIEEFYDEIEIETQYCPFCDDIIHSGAFFCERCGNIVSCLSCGSPIKESTKYCGKCGANIKRDATLERFIDNE